MKGTVPDIWRYINAFIIIILLMYQKFGIASTIIVNAPNQYTLSRNG